MMRNEKTKTIAVVQEKSSNHGKMMLLGGAVIAATVAWGALAKAQETTISHGFSYFGDLKYDADFKHLDYVNPDAPKGGEMAQWTQGTFDSFVSYSRQGVAAWGASIGIESLMEGVADEISSEYCLLCETIEYPEDHSWVIFNMRPEAKFSDGTPLTAEDVVYTFNLTMEQALERMRGLIGFAGDWTDIVSYLPDGWDADPQRRRSTTAATFAASLELAKEGKIEIRQGEMFAPIQIRKKDPRS